jgi:adenylate cyclase
VQDEISEAGTIAIAPAIDEAELQRAIRKPPGNLDAWVAYQRGLWHLSKFNSHDNSLAEEFFQQAIDLDATFAGGYAGLASAQLHGAVVFHTLLPEAMISIEVLARRAVELDGADAEARACLGWMLLHGGDHQGARALIELAVTMSPNLSSAHGMLGQTLIFSGSPKEGIAAVQTSIRLDPRHSASAFRLQQLVVGHYFSQEYEASVEAAKQAIRSYPDFPVPHRWLAAAFGQLGRSEEARAALGKAVAISPTAFSMYVRAPRPWMRSEDHAHLLEGLRKAGWQG